MNGVYVKNQRFNIFVKAAIITFICFCIASIVGQEFEYDRLCRQEDALNAQIESRTADIEELENVLEQPNDDEYVKKIARQSLGYHLPEEIIYYNDLAK